jgi:hypothetical protein
MMPSTRLGNTSRCLLAVLCLVAMTARSPAQTARVEAVDGALLARSGQSWHAVKSGQAWPNDVLVVALPQAEFTSANGAVRGIMLADVGHRTPYPVLESALIMHAPEQVDLDVTLDRGIVGFMNIKKEGEAKVRLRFRDQRWLLTLKAPDTRVGIEIYGRHAPGAKDLHDEPVTNVAFLVTRGRAFVDLGEQGHALTAPPGNSLMLWDTVTRTVEMEHLDKAPRSLRDLDEKEAEVFKQIVAATQQLNTGSPVEAATKLVGSPQPVQRLAGVTVLGALDDLPHLLEALGDPARPDVREQAVLVLRHWLGREPGQIARLAHVLKQQGYSDTQARMLVQLLVGFSAAQRAEPATYDLLLDYLDHNKLAVRELAHWHLVRLAPAGRTIAYDPAAAAPQREESIRQWREVIPAGSLPRRTVNK